MALAPETEDYSGTVSISLSRTTQPRVRALAVGGQQTRDSDPRTAQGDQAATGRRRLT